jgi:hypothetical protein
MATRTCAALLAALSICGCATTTQSPNTAGVAGGPSLCVGQTGSMIQNPNCTPTGRSYSQADIARSMAMTPAQVLSSLQVGAGVSR